MFGRSSAFAVIGPSTRQGSVYVPKLTAVEQSGRTAALNDGEGQHTTRCRHPGRRAGNGRSQSIGDVPASVGKRGPATGDGRRLPVGAGAAKLPFTEMRSLPDRRFRRTFRTAAL